MSRWINAGLIVLLALAFLPAIPAHADTFPECDEAGVQDSGALFCITNPHTPYWNGGLVIFAHGYVAVDKPLAIPWDQMKFVSSTGEVRYMPDVINDLGFAFATTSYSVNGLAVKQGIDDVVNLVEVFKQRTGMQPAFVLLVGASEGGLVTTLAIEQNPLLFSGGLAACGPIGSFTGQINYWGDFRVVFDYFMDRPGFNVLPGSAVDIPKVLMKRWESVYKSRIGEALMADFSKTDQLFLVTQAPYDALYPAETKGKTTEDVLWYNVFATNDAIAKLGGQPFDNHDRVYNGSENDILLNRKVKRFSADPSALAEIDANYDTTGQLMTPFVTMHTTGDPIVPYWHQTLYMGKAPGVYPYFPYMPITIDRYGHCAFTLEEIQAGFGQLAFMVMSGGLPPVAPMLKEAGEPLEQAEETYYYEYH